MNIKKSNLVRQVYFFAFEVNYLIMVFLLLLLR